MCQVKVRQLGVDLKYFAFVLRKLLAKKPHENSCNWKKENHSSSLFVRLAVDFIFHFLSFSFYSSTEDIETKWME
jgi:hypothetical protein